MISDNYDSLSPGGKALDLLQAPDPAARLLHLRRPGLLQRFIHANMQEVIRQDYIRTARAKGVGPAACSGMHAFRNTLIPLVTLIGLTLPSLLSGAVILEQIFTWPGMGKLSFESISERDYHTDHGPDAHVRVAHAAGQLLADILYAVVDPRVTYPNQPPDCPSPRASNCPPPPPASRARRAASRRAATGAKPGGASARKPLAA